LNAAPSQNFAPHHATESRADVFVMPHALPMEKAVLSVAMQWPEKLGEVVNLPPELFHIPAHHLIFDELRKIAANGETFDLSLFVQRLINSGQLEGCGGASGVYDLYSYQASAQHFPAHVRELQFQHARRQAFRDSEALRRVALESHDPAELAEAVRNSTKAAQTALEAAQGGTRDGIAEALATRRFDCGAVPPRPVPILKLGESVISTPGNILNIQAPAKAGKSAALSGMLAALFTRSPEADTLGFQADNPEGKAVIHFDTEQSRFDHDQLVRRALRRAKVTAPPPWFYSYSVADLGHHDRLQAWECAIDSAARECSGVHAVFLDGVADLVLDPNDSGEAFAFVGNLHSTAIRHDCAIITVLHENPGSESGKTRGHLGSQIERKAETNLRLSKDANGITTVWADRARHGHIPKDSGTCFEWSDAAGMHVSCGTAREIKDQLKRNQHGDEATRVFLGADDAGLTFTELTARICEVLDVGSESTAARRIRAWLKDGGPIRKTRAGTYTLA
jgi:hypothetical protein